MAIVLGCERRDVRVPRKLRKAEEDAVTKPPEVKPTLVRSAFAVISSRFPSEVSLQDLHVFVREHGLGISRATLRDMVEKARAKRRDWRAKGRDLPLKVMRDTLWVEDVMWALRVRKTRREFDKWEVNEHRDEWVAILEAATPDHPTVFATPVDHRIAPPLSYTEVLEESSYATSANTTVSAAPASGGFSSYGGSGNEQRAGREGGGGGRLTEARPLSAGKMWAPLESRLPASLLTTMRPGSAAAVAGGGSAGAALAGGRGSVGTAGAGDAATLRCYPSGGEGGRAGSSSGGGKGPSRRSSMSAQERGLCGRKLSPTRVARSTRFIPRRRPPCRVDGRRRPRSETANEEATELYEIEADINNTGFASTAASVESGVMSAVNFLTTVSPLKVESRDGPGAVWGSVDSALTFEDQVNPSANNRIATTDKAGNDDDDDDDDSNIRQKHNVSNNSISVVSNGRGSSSNAPAPAVDVQVVAQTRDTSPSTSPPLPLGSTSDMEPPTLSSMPLSSHERCGTARTASPTMGEASGTATGPVVVVARAENGVTEPREEPQDRDEAGAAGWWRDAMSPGSYWPKTRRSLVDVGAENVSRRWGLERGAWSESKDESSKRPLTAPTCGFSVESKQRCLESRLERRSSMNALEGLASAQVQGMEAALTRARSRAQFRHVLGRTTIRQNLDRSYKQKACDSLALDLRGYGAHLIAPETSSSPRDELPAPRPVRSAVRTHQSCSGSGGSRFGGKGADYVGVGVSGPLSRKRPPPFRAAKGRSVQEERVAVATDQAGMWGTCGQAQFGRFGEKPYVHSFRPQTSPAGSHGFGTP